MMPTLIAGLVWTAVPTSAVLWAAWRAARRFLPTAGISTQLVWACTFAYAGLSVALQVIGATGFMRRPVFIAVAACCCLGGLLARSPRRRHGQPDGKPNRIDKRLVACAIGGAACLPIYLIGAGALVRPVRALSDAPIYHLPLALQWWRTGRWEYVATPFGELAATYFPANGDLWYTWLIGLEGGGSLMPRGGGVVPAKVGQLPFLAWATLAAYALARRLGATPIPAVLAACLLTASPLVQAWGGEALVDLPFAACFLSAAVFLAPAAGEGPRARLVAIGLALGAALGTKTVGLAFAPLIFLPALLLLRPGRRRRDFAWLFVSMLAPCAFWYGMNWWKCGNPLYPLHVNIAGIEVFPGWYDSATMRKTSGYHWSTDDLKLAAMAARQFADWPLAATWCAGMVSCLFGKRRWCAIGVLAAVAVNWWWVPYNREVRFLIAAWGVGAALLALPLTRWPFLQWPAAALVGWLLWNSAEHSRAAFDRAFPAKRPSAAAAFLDTDAIEGRAWPAWQALEDATLDRGAVVAYCGTNLPYYLWGSELQNAPVYANVFGPANWLPHDFHAEARRRGDRRPWPSAWPQWHRLAPDFGQWRKNLDELGAEYVFAARENFFARPDAPPVPPGGMAPFTIEYHWMIDRPEEFQRLGPPPDLRGEPWGVVFRIKRPPGPPPATAPK